MKLLKVKNLQYYATRLDRLSNPIKKILKATLHLGPKFSLPITNNKNDKKKFIKHIKDVEFHINLKINIDKTEKKIIGHRCNFAICKHLDNMKYQQIARSKKR